MAKGLTKSWICGRRDAGGVENILADGGPETALAVLVIRQAVEDWQHLQSAQPANQRARQELTEFFNGAWFEFIVRELGLEPTHITTRVRVTSSQS